MSLRNFAVAWLVVLGCSLALIGQETKPKAVKYALIVGVDYYEDSKRLDALKYAEADAKALAEVLKNGFQVTMLVGENATKSKIEAAFQDILKKGTGADTLLVAFSGHGHQFKPPGGKEVEPFLCTRECKKYDSVTQVSVNQMLSDAGDSKIGKALFLIDACRVDPDPNNKGSSGVDGNAAKVKAQTVALFATTNGKKAREHGDAGGKGNGHGLFMSEVLGALAGEAKNKRGTVTWNGLVNHIAAEVNLKSKALFPDLPENDHQMPHAIGSLVGDAVLVEVASVGDETIEEFEWKGEKRKRVVRTYAYGDVKIEFVQVQKGSFLMGSRDSDKDASPDTKPQHRVNFTKPLWVGKYPVTREQFAAFVKLTKYVTDCESPTYNSSEFRKQEGYHSNTGARVEGGHITGSHAPGSGCNWRNPGWEQKSSEAVVDVSWNDANAFCLSLQKQTGMKVRLLTEAEYEYANRGGTFTRYQAGEEESDMKDYAKTDYLICNVGAYKTNGFGIYDLSNACWCSDSYLKDAYTIHTVDNPSILTSKDYRKVIRGYWYTTLAVYDRKSESAKTTRYDIGFRVGFGE